MPKPLRAPSIPKPFQRDAISLDHPRRIWADTRIDRIKPGDMIQDFGLVGTTETFAMQDPAQIRFKAVNGVTGDIRYWTFTPNYLAATPDEMVPTLFAFSEG